MTDSKLHDDAIVFDGLIVSNWSRDVFADMRRGGLTAANCTCSVWEGFHDTMVNLGQWNRWFRESDDLIVKARTTDDIRRAKEQGRTAVVLGFQNTSAFEDRLEFVEIFKDAGIGIVQMTYNTQNLVGSGCYESTDSGLSDFGREVVAEMNRVGMLCDLSHVGSVTSRDVIEASAKPVAYSHCLPAGLKAHPRNKSDEELRFIAEHGGFVGVTMFPPFLRRGAESTVDDYVEAIDYVIDLAGEDSVGIGTDFTQGHGEPFFRWITHDKGYARRLTEFGEIKFPEGFSSIGDFPNVTAAMERAGWSERRIRKVLGLNWLRVLDEAWGR
ncbi:MAG: dipeptidase [Gammaproteobacteria bacterium]|nr:dipeptidase [Gammaproteobacteria bacterium]